MSIYDRLWEIAADDFGLVTASEAKAAGISAQALSRLVRKGLLTRLGYGVYRVYHHVSGNWDPYAEAVKLAGPDAYLYGESVIAMHELCPTNPTRIFIASPRRVRRSLTPEKKIVNRSTGDDITSYEGIPSQTVAGAIRTCIRHMLPDRLLAATKKASAQGLINEKEESELLELLDAAR